MRILIATVIAGTMVSGIAIGQTLEERGQYLVEGPAACGNCHSPKGPDAEPYSGFLIRELTFTAFAQNITPGSRVAGWSDEELARAIREGVRPDGTVIGPPMPIHLYRGLSDDDLAAIVAYLRTLPSVASEHVENTYPFPLPPSYGPPVETVAAPSADDAIAYGAYLAGPVAHCVDCHSFVDGRPDLENNLGGGGGHHFEGPWGRSVPANITNGPEGLADYTDAEIATMIAEGTRTDGSQMLPPMPYSHYSNISESDMAAIVAYLRTLPALP